MIASPQPKALFITHRHLLPITGGDQIRIVQMLKMLCCNYRVTVVGVTHTNSYNSVKDKFSGIEAEHWFYVPKIKRAIQATHFFSNGYPILTNIFHNKRMQKFIDRVIDDFDLVFCASPASAIYLLDRECKPAKYLDMTDSLTMNIKNAAKIAKGVRKKYLADEAVRMMKYEQKCRSQFYRVSYISEIDLNYVGKSSNCYIVHNYVDMPQADELCDQANTRQQISFIGKMDYEPNITAVKFFVREIFPELRKRNPCLEFHIVGACPSSEVKNLESGGIYVRGYVDSLTDIFRSSAVIVAPMLSGSGIQNKILQAMSHHCCVVTTPIGAEGLDSTSNAFVISDSSCDMVQAIDKLMADPGLRSEYGKAAGQYVADCFSPQHVSREFDIFIG